MIKPRFNLSKFEKLVSKLDPNSLDDQVTALKHILSLPKSSYKPSEREQILQAFREDGGFDPEEVDNVWGSISSYRNIYAAANEGAPGIIEKFIKDKNTGDNIAVPLKQFQQRYESDKKIWEKGWDHHPEWLWPKTKPEQNKTKKGKTKQPRPPAQNGNQANIGTNSEPHSDSQQVDNVGESSEDKGKGQEPNPPNAGTESAGQSSPLPGDKTKEQSNGPSAGTDPRQQGDGGTEAQGGDTGKPKPPANNSEPPKGKPGETHGTKESSPPAGDGASQGTGKPKSGGEGEPPPASGGDFNIDTVFGSNPNLAGKYAIGKAKQQISDTQAKIDAIQNAEDMTDKAKGDAINKIYSEVYGNNVLDRKTMEEAAYNQLKERGITTSDYIHAYGPPVAATATGGAVLIGLASSALGDSKGRKSNAELYSTY